MSNTSTNSYKSPNEITVFKRGKPMPVFGLGTWQSSPEDVKLAVKTAVTAGYRLIDTASNYGNEEAIGEALEELFKEGIVTRKELFITTKAWTNELAPGKVEPALRASLKRLKLDSVDLYLAHMPTATDDDGRHLEVSIEDIWREFHSVHDLKLADSIGVSNWSLEQIDRVCALEVLEPAIFRPQIVQVEMHLYFPQNMYVRRVRDNLMEVQGYAPFGSPGRHNFDVPKRQKLESDDYPSPLDDPVVRDLAQKFNKTPYQILLRYLIDRLIPVIPKSVNPEHIRENINVFDFLLAPEDITRLESRRISHRLFTHDFMRGHPEDAFATERQPAVNPVTNPPPM